MEIPDPFDSKYRSDMFLQVLGPGYLLAKKGGVLLTLRGQILPQVLAKRTSIREASPYELPAWTTYLRYRILAQSEVLSRLESSHLRSIRHRERRAPRLLPWTDFISSLPLRTGSMHSFDHPFSYLRRWFGTDHPCLAMWWHRSEFTTQMQRLGQAAMNEVQQYAAKWKQPINVSKTE